MSVLTQRQAANTRPTPQHLLVDFRDDEQLRPLLALYRLHKVALHNEAADVKAGFFIHLMARAKARGIRRGVPGATG
jgi:hypothetical protein